MNKEELRNILIAEKIKDSYYDIDSIGKDEALVLTSENGRWCVYYSERGMRNDITYYDSEDEACQRILASLRRDPGAKIDYVPPKFRPNN